MLKEFKEFAMRGSVVDLAVGFILGGAFTTIVQSLVTDILMPPLGLVLGGADFSALFIALDGGSYDSVAQAAELGAPTLNYGLFVNNVIAFVILAFALFFLIKAINRMNRGKQETTPEAPPPARPRQEELLEQIRDLLKGDRPAPPA